MLAGPGQIYNCSECVIDAHRQVDELIADRLATEALVELARRRACCIPSPLLLDIRALA
jgi:hypothetical protein